MAERDIVAVVGLGEIGRPVRELYSATHHTIGVDLKPFPSDRKAGFLHICYPYEISDFVGETTRYIKLFEPKVTIIHSTIAVGTTRRVAEVSRSAVVHSPVRGKHSRMLEELRSYTKFIGATNEDDGDTAARHLQAVGVRTRVLASPEATELAKLTETTYFGLMIAWAQEVERYCDAMGADYDEVVSFYDEIPFFPPVKYFPGIIGGHCVMPNIEILEKCKPSKLLAAIRDSNTEKVQRESSAVSASVSPELVRF